MYAILGGSELKRGEKVPVKELSDGTESKLGKLSFSLTSTSSSEPPSEIISGHVRTSNMKASPRVVPISMSVTSPFTPKLMPSQSNDMTIFC
uniref:Uncharacterized protein n=1 Tax=Glossina palpalis gambiensis TaxID=67801 RepID=A0A1B0AYR3_9MUSC